MLPVLYTQHSVRGSEKTCEQSMWSLIGLSQLYNIISVEYKHKFTNRCKNTANGKWNLIIPDFKI